MLLEMENLINVKTLTVILLSIILSNLVVQPVFAPHFTVKYDKRSYTPGDDGKCTVEIQMATEDPSKDRSPLRFTKVALIFSFQTYTWEGGIILNPDDSTQKTITIDFLIPQGTSDGEYSGNIRLTYLVQNKGGDWEGPYSYTYAAGKITVRGSTIPGSPVNQLQSGSS
jgi:hypothetical protein